MSRPWWAGDPERSRLCATVERLIPGAKMIRVYPDRSVNAYRADFTALPDRTPQQDVQVAQLIRGYFGAVDWRLAHDFYPGDGRLCTAPLPGQPGRDPAADGMFGSAPGPTHLPTTRIGVRLEGAL